MQPEATTAPATPEPITDWAILEIMGHERLAGQVSETTVAGQPMLRVDVPASEELAGFTRLLSGASIFSMTPVPESVARLVAGRLQKTAVSGIPAYGFTFGQLLQMSQALGLPAPKEPVARIYPDDDDDQYAGPAL